MQNTDRWILVFIFRLVNEYFTTDVCTISEMPTMFIYTQTKQIDKIVHRKSSFNYLCNKVLFFVKKKIGIRQFCYSQDFISIWNLIGYNYVGQCTFYMGYWWKETMSNTNLDNLRIQNQCKCCNYFQKAQRTRLYS